MTLTLQELFSRYLSIQKYDKWLFFRTESEKSFLQHHSDCTAIKFIVQPLGRDRLEEWEWVLHNLFASSIRRVFKKNQDQVFYFLHSDYFVVFYVG